jgi:hypothetical protein
VLKSISLSNPFNIQPTSLSPGPNEQGYDRLDSGFREHTTPEAQFPRRLALGNSVNRGNPPSRTALQMTLQALRVSH